MKIKINDRSVEVARKKDYDRDTVTRKHTAFDSFHALVLAPGGYRPSVYLGGKPAKDQRELLFLAFEYNRYQAAHSDARRVYKGDWRPVFFKEHPILNETVFACEVPGCTNIGCDIAAISIDNQEKRSRAVCRQHLEAAQEDCRHKFIDSKCCLKCGWVTHRHASKDLHAPATLATITKLAGKWLQGD